MTVVAVSDTGPLIHLGEIRSLELIDVFDRLFIPETVYDELEHGGVPDGLEELSFERIEPDELQPETTELDPGERAAIAVANDREAVLLTDDLAARDVAVEHDIDVHGSLGVIAIAYAKDLVDRDEAAALMRALQLESVRTRQVSRSSFTPEYTEFLDLASPHRLFAVNALHDSFKRMGVEPPQIVSAVLLPFGDRIVSDGHLQADAFVTDSMTQESDEEIEKARSRYRLIDRLPAPREPTEQVFRDEDGNPPIEARQLLDQFYVVRTRQTGSVDDTPAEALEYLLECSSGSTQSRPWRESTAVGWGLGHDDFSVTTSVRQASPGKRSRELIGQESEVR